MKKKKRGLRMTCIWKNRYASLKEPEPLFTVLVAAAGSGQRMGGVYKPLLAVGGRPLLAYSLDALQKNGFVRQIVVSAPREKFDEIEQTARECGCDKLKAIAEGGQTRAESVRKAFEKVFAEKKDITPFVAVHDAARPLITQKMLDDVFFACVKYGGAVASTKVRDAVKRAGLDGMVTEDVDRDGLYQMQTPQAFDTDIFHTALAVAKRDGNDTAVDDAALVRAAGFKVMCVETGFANFKITYPEDVRMAEALLEARKNGSFGTEA